LLTLFYECETCLQAVRDGRVFENSILRKIFGLNVAKQWLLKGCVIKLFRICALKDRLIIADKGRSFVMCVCGGGGGKGKYVGV